MEHSYELTCFPKRQISRIHFMFLHKYYTIFCKNEVRNVCLFHCFLCPYLVSQLQLGVQLSYEIRDIFLFE